MQQNVGQYDENVGQEFNNDGSWDAWPNVEDDNVEVEKSEEDITEFEEEVI